jgi:hypothetical protein
LSGLCTHASTIIAFGPSTLKGVGTAPSPSPDQPVYRSMEPSSPEASPWGRRGRPCVIHGWRPCPNRVKHAHGSSSSCRQGEAEGEEEEDEARRISVVTGHVEAPAIRRMAHISIGPRGQPQGSLVPWTTTPPTSSTPSLATSDASINRSRPIGL